MKPAPSLNAEDARRDERAAHKYLLGLINSSRTTQAIATSAELRIADLLAAGPRDIEALARASSCHAPSLQRLISALASLDLVEQRDDGLVALTRTGALLRTDADDSLAWWSLLCGRSARELSLRRTRAATSESATAETAAVDRQETDGRWRDVIASPLLLLWYIATALAVIRMVTDPARPA